MDTDTLIAKLRERGGAEDVAAAAALAQHKHGKDAFLGSTAYHDYAAARNYAQWVWDEPPPPSATINIGIEIEGDEYACDRIERVTDGMPRILQQIVAARCAQDVQWGGRAHDDEHTPSDWYQLLSVHVARLVRRPGIDEAPMDDYRQRLVKIAAIAGAAAQAWDRLQAASQRES
jgi:hypothetical protein